MKSIVFVSVLLVLMLGLAACAADIGGADPAGAPEASAPADDVTETAAPAGPESRSYSDAAGMQFFEVGGTIYCITNPTGSGTAKIMFTDEEYRDWMPLCGRPDCAHRDRSCNSYLEGNSSPSMCVIGEYIYYIITPVFSVGEQAAVEDMLPQLWRMRPDGTEHELVLVFKPESLEFLNAGGFETKFIGTYAVFSYYETQYAGSMGEAQDRRHIAVDLRESKPVQRTVDIEETHPIAGVGNLLYGFSLDGKSDETRIVRLDMDIGATEEICILPMEPGPVGELIGDTLHLFFADTGTIVNVNVTTGEFTVREKVIPVNNLYVEYGETTVTYAQFFLEHGGWIFTDELNDEREPTGTLIYDLDGNLFARLDHPEGEKPIMVRAMIGDCVFGYTFTTKNLFYSARTMQTPEWYFKLGDIGTDELTWRRWEP